MTEPDLFYAFKKAYLPDLKVAVDTASPFDAICHTAKVVVEFKCRRLHYNNLILEWPKYEVLLNRAANRGYTPVYICSTPLGVWAWNLTHLDLKWYKRELPKQTDFSNNTPVIKQVAYLDIEDGSYLSRIKV